MKTNKPKALYVHVPFCDVICAYCDFTRVVTHPKLIEDYLYALAEDNAITETITADVRDGFVSGWSQGQNAIESLSSSLETYFSFVFINV